MSSLKIITRMFGIELEFFLLDRYGNTVNTADRVLGFLKRKNLKNIAVRKECGKSMIELISFPHRSHRHLFSDFFKDLESVLYETNVNDLNLFCLGTYPGKNSNIMRSDKRYISQEKVLGNDQFRNAGKCCGFHYHYTLPRNTFDHNTFFFNPDISSSKKKKILNLYNLFIALDPAISTFMQSSPYYEGKLVGKDSRIIMYRGEKIFDKSDSVYKHIPQYGNLNNYQTNYESLLSNIKSRADNWMNVLKENNLSFKDFAKKKVSYLDTSWKPVKISMHGTIESRGADMNRISNVVALSSLLTTFFRYLQNNKVNIVPSKIGNTKPFFMDGKNIYVPEFQVLRDSLLKKSALYGLESKEVYRYCKSLIKLIERIIPTEKMARLRSFKKMISEKRTVSDGIIDFVKEKQGNDNYLVINEKTAKEFALLESKSLFKDLLITKKMTQELLF